MSLIVSAHTSYLDGKTTYLIHKLLIFCTGCASCTGYCSSIILPLLSFIPSFNCLAHFMHSKKLFLPIFQSWKELLNVYQVVFNYLVFDLLICIVRSCGCSYKSSSKSRICYGEIFVKFGICDICSSGPLNGITFAVSGIRILEI